MLHFEYIIDKDDLPHNAISECTRPGQCADEPVKRWVATLGFTVDRGQAINCLKGFGAWDLDEMAYWTDTDVAEKIFWLACGSFAEGDDIFCME